MKAQRHLIRTQPGTQLAPRSLRTRLEIAGVLAFLMTLSGALVLAVLNDDGAEQLMSLGCALIMILIVVGTCYTMLWPKSGRLRFISDSVRGEVSLPSSWLIRPLLLLFLLACVVAGLAWLMGSEWASRRDGYYNGGSLLMGALLAVIATVVFLRRGAEPSRLTLNSDYLEFQSPFRSVLVEWEHLEEVALVRARHELIEIRHAHGQIDIWPGPFASDSRLIVDLLYGIRKRPEILDDLETRDVESVLQATLSEGRNRGAALRGQARRESDEPVGGPAAVPSQTGGRIAAHPLERTQVIRADPVTPKVDLDAASWLWTMGLLALPVAGVIALMWVGFEHPGPERAESFAIGLALLLVVLGHGYMRVRRRPGRLRIRVEALCEDVSVTDSRVLRPVAWMVAALYAIAGIACWIRVDESIQLDGPVALWMPFIAALLAAPSTWSFVRTTLERSYISINPFFLGIAVSSRYESIRWGDLRSVELVADRGLRIRIEHDRVLNLEAAPFASDPRLIVDLLHAVMVRPEVLDDLETFDVGSLLRQS